jgi:hypothetical protein
LVVRLGRMLAKWLTPLSTSQDFPLGPPVAKWTIGGADMLTIAAVSTEYVRVPVQATVAGLAVNPTTLPVSMAFLTSNADPQSGDWHTASWDTTPSGGFVAQCLIGPSPGVVQLTAATYWAWIRIEDTPEVVIRPAGMLTIT